MFNTLKYARMLEDVGFSQKQAETSINILAEVMEDKLATKQDLKDLATELRFEIQKVRSDLTIRLGAMLAASIAVMTALQTYLIRGR